MWRPIHRRLLHLFFTGALLALAVTPSVEARAKPREDPLAPTRLRLLNIQKCLPEGNVDIVDLGRGLLSTWSANSYQQPPMGGGYGYGQPIPRAPAIPPTPPPPPPDAYLQSLDQDLQLCAAAAQATDPKVRSALIKQVSEDIAIKAEDCSRFGMGRQVTVKVNTMRGAAADNGWQVFYKWAGSSFVSVSELRIPMLTSPAVIDLPPGKYIFRAEKTLPDSTVAHTQPVTLLVGFKQTIICELPL